MVRGSGPASRTCTAQNSLPTCLYLQARFPAAGTVLQLQQTLDLHSVLYTLVWGQRAQQVETTPDGKPAGPTFALGSFEAQDDELQWVRGMDGLTCLCRVMPGHWVILRDGR